jgi:hypothetical protein
LSFAGWLMARAFTGLMPRRGYEKSLLNVWRAVAATPGGSRPRPESMALPAHLQQFNGLIDCVVDSLVAEILQGEKTPTKPEILAGVDSTINTQLDSQRSKASARKCTTNPAVKQISEAEARR